MKLHLFCFSALVFLWSCDSNVKESTIHRRNFSKNVFEEEFGSVQVGCDTVNNKVLLPNTKWLNIDPKYTSKENPEVHTFELNKKLSLKERTYDHDLVLEKIDNGAFMFRYTGVQIVTDTLKVLAMADLAKSNISNIDSSRILFFKGVEYYNMKKSQVNSNDIKTIFKSMRTEDKGRVVCKCDYYTE